jgi:hypothetical protein
MPDKWNVRDFPWLRDLPEPLRTVMARAVHDQGERAEYYLRSILPAVARCDAESIVFTTLTRLSNGLEPHPDIALAGLKLLNEVIALREKLQQALHPDQKPIDA